MIEILCTGSVFGSACDDQRVPALVVRDDALLALGDEPAACARARPCTRSIASSSCGSPIEREALAGREQRGLVHEVGEVGAREPGRAAGDHVEVDARRRAASRRRAPEDRLAALEVGAVDDDLAVEAAGPQQRGVEDVGPVRRPRAGSRPSSGRSRPSRRAAGSASARARRGRRRGRRRGGGRRRRSRRRTRSRAPPSSPARRGRGRGMRRRRRTSRRSRSR